MQHRIKGKRIAMVFQDPMTSLDPTMTIGRQLTEGMRYHLHLSQADADKRAEELLEMVGIESPKEQNEELSSSAFRLECVSVL